MGYRGLAAAVPFVLLLVPGADALATQAHVSQTGEGVVIQWALTGDTRSLPNGSVDWGSGILYGNSIEGEMVGYVDASPYIGTSSSGIVRDIAEAPATLYRAVLGTMTPGTTFHYRIVDGAGVPTGDITATTAPSGSSLRFLAYADQGTYEDGSLGPPAYRPGEVIDAALTYDPDLVLVAGDLSYSEEAALRWWNQWFDIVEPLASTRPFYAAVGNHDRDFVVGYDHWYKRFSFARDEQNYAFDAGPVHFIVLNSQEACLEGEMTEPVQRVNPNCTVTEQTNAPLENTAITDFIKADLADAKERGVPWIVATFHHPPYAHGGYNESNSGASYMWWLRDHWIPLFEQYGVDLVITGHDHVYERSWPMLANQTQTTSGSTFREGKGIVYLTTGGGGRSTYTPSSGAPWWLATIESAHHVTVVDATATKLKVQARGLDGASLDAFEIRKVGGGSQNELPLWLAMAALAGIVARRLSGRFPRSARR